MILYFTGTGNSRFIANILGNEMDDKVVDLTECIKNGNFPNFYSKKPYVFVAPTYAWRLPFIFQEWIRACKFFGNNNVYFVLTCGSDIGAAGNYAKKLCAEKKFNYMGVAEIVMPENYIAVFSAPSEEEEKEILFRAREKAHSLCENILEEKPLDVVRINLVGHLCSDIVNPLFRYFIVRDKKFYASDACVSCEICVDSCMFHNITLKDGKPVWGGLCTHCMACICKCPVEAIEYGKHTKGLRRYVCPEEQ